MRIELNNSFTGIIGLRNLCEKAKADRFDAVFVPPMSVSMAGEMLGRNDITMVTTAGRDEDVLDTKLMGIESAARAGAEEVIVSLSRHHIFDEKWDLLAKEIFQIRQMGEIHRVFIWIGCGFAHLDRPSQATIAGMLGKLGLRARNPSAGDIQLAKLCGIRDFCVGLHEYGLEPEVQQELYNAGAGQFVLRDKPEQLTTAKLNRTEVNL